MMTSLRALACVSLGLLACNADAPAKPSLGSSPQDGPPKPSVDRSIERAVAAAQSFSGPPDSGELKPPPDGVIERAAADREVAIGGAAQLVLGERGSEPRVVLLAPQSSGSVPSAPIAGSLRLAYRFGGGILPTVEEGLQVLSAPLEIAFRVDRAVPASAQPGRLPPQAQTEIAKLQGSRFVFPLSQEGGLQGFRIEGAMPAGLDVLGQASGEVLANLLLPVPREAVGAGGFWMIKSRETSAGADTLVYRLVRVESADSDAVKLNVQIRRYLTDRVLPLGDLPPHRLQRFQSEGQARLTFRPSERWPHSAEIQEQSVALLGLLEAGQPALPAEKGVPLQTEVKAEWTLR